MRINPGMKLKEPTYQVVLDAFALTTCYPAFLITAFFSREEDDDDEDDTKDDKGNDDGDDSDENDDDDDNDNDGDDDDDDNVGNDNDDSDQEMTKSDRDEIPNLSQFNKEHEEDEEENINEFTDKEDDEENEEESDDDSWCEQEEEDAYVTLTTVHHTHKTEGLMQSSSVLSDFTEKLLNFDNVSPADNEIPSLMDTIVRTKEPSGQTSTLITVPITVIPTTIPPPPHFLNPLS
ncbi:hypothetical protein Tco_0381429 [Tanacetum coccineum]